MLNVAINGLGRIGRATLKIVLDKPTLRLTAVNDVLAADNLAYLLKFDTVYGRWTRDVSAQENDLNIDGKDYPVLERKGTGQAALAPNGRRCRVRVYRRL